MKWLACAMLGVLSLGLAGVARADDDPTGTWKWTSTFNNQTRERTLTLKLEGGKLTGSLLGRDNKETQIEEASFANGEISFKVTRERNGQKSETHYQGKLSVDTIQGQIEFERNGQKETRVWTANRVKS